MKEDGRGHARNSQALCPRAGTAQSGRENKLIERLPFDRPTFVKLVRIGNASHLHDPEVSAHLPASYSVVYELAQLNQQQFEDALGKGLINPKLKRAEAQALGGNGPTVPRPEKQPSSDHSPEQPSHNDSGSPGPTEPKSKPLLASTAGLDRRGSETLLDPDRQALANLRTGWDSSPSLVATWEAVST